MKGSKTAPGTSSLRLKQQKKQNAIGTRAAATACPEAIL
jgi:hypothetical protein